MVSSLSLASPTRCSSIPPDVKTKMSQNIDRSTQAKLPPGWGGKPLALQGGRPEGDTFSGQTDDC